MALALPIPLAMTPSASVLLGLRARTGPDRDLRSRLERWVLSHGLRPRFTPDAGEALRWLAEEPFAASLFDSDMELRDGQMVWQLVDRGVARRSVLLVRERRSNIWFGALRIGVGTVLPYPPAEDTFEEALRAVGAFGTHGSTPK